MVPALNTVSKNALMLFGVVALMGAFYVATDSLQYGSNELVAAAGGAGVSRGRPAAVGEYRAFMDGMLFAHMSDVSRADARANCRRAAQVSQYRVIRCVWGNTEIYRNAKTTIVLDTGTTTNTIATTTPEIQ